MQTFLPYSSFTQSAAVLDNKRLGKQRVEVLQILNALLGKSKGWVNHPATKMWRGHEGMLALYGITVCEHWRSRGFKDTVMDKLYALVREHGLEFTDDSPWWWGNYDFHRSHRSNLLRKDAEHYSQHFSDVPNDLPYVWSLDDVQVH